MITIFTPVEKVTVTPETPEQEAHAIKVIEDALSKNGVLGLHNPACSIFIGAEALKNSVIKVDKI